MNELKEYNELTLEREKLMAERKKLRKQIQDNYFKLLENNQKFEALLIKVSKTHP